MKSSSVAAVIVIVLLLVGAGVYFLTGQNSELTNENDSIANTNLPELNESDAPNLNSNNEDETDTPTPLTAEVVAQHDKRDDCWTIINGSVYDITSYIPRHQGGDEIERACGIDATSLFTQRTTDEGETVGSGTPHSSSAASQLATLKIGELQ